MLSAHQSASAHILSRLGINQQMPGQSQALLVHALHKSASMFLHKFFDDLCRRKKVPYFSIHNQEPEKQEVPEGFDKSFVLGPLRTFKTDLYEFPMMNQVKHLIQVRDPRDILVSEYFSLGWLHSDDDWNETDKLRREQIRQLTIDEFVLNEAEFSKYPLLDRYLPILDLCEQANVQVVRYEDMVLNFSAWLDQVLDVADVQPRAIWRRRLVRQYRDEFQPGGTKQPHKRNVMPGDHRAKLKPETIDVLNRQYEPILTALGYSIAERSTSRNRAA